jgi:hypothetical protein
MGGLVKGSIGETPKAIEMFRDASKGEFFFDKPYRKQWVISRVRTSHGASILLAFFAFIP